MKTFLKNISSEDLPPIIHVILSKSSSLDSREDSLGRYCANPNDPLDLGIIVNLKLIKRDNIIQILPLVMVHLLLKTNSQQHVQLHEKLQFFFLLLK